MCSWSVGKTCIHVYPGKEGGDVVVFLGGGGGGVSQVNPSALLRILDFYRNFFLLTFWCLLLLQHITKRIYIITVPKSPDIE